MSEDAFGRADEELLEQKVAKQRKGKGKIGLCTSAVSERNLDATRASVHFLFQVTETLSSCFSWLPCRLELPIALLACLLLPPLSSVFANHRSSRSFDSLSLSLAGLLFSHAERHHDAPFVRLDAGLAFDPPRSSDHIMSSELLPNLFSPSLHLDLGLDCARTISRAFGCELCLFLLSPSAVSPRRRSRVAGNVHRPFRKPKV